MVDNKNQENRVKDAVEEAKSKAINDIESGEKPSNNVEENQEGNEDIKESEKSTEEYSGESNEHDKDLDVEADVATDEEPKKSLFGKKKKDKKDEKIEELTDKLTRQMAEFENFRKRNEKEKSHMYEIGAKDIIEKLLPIVDNFERGLEAVPEEEKEHPFMDGMDKVYKHLMTTLEGVGVKPIEAVGNEFNPDLHNAVMHVEDDGYGENTVVEEFQKGYTYRDNMVRHSMVKVAN